MSRRRNGTLLPIENEILEVALSMVRSGRPTFHGFGIAQQMREQSRSRSLTAHGTLYKALGRLEEFGILSSHWQDDPIQGRPRRRLYQLTGRGIEVAQELARESTSAVTPATAPEPV